jgi:hypothetical protein
MNKEIFEVLDTKYNKVMFTVRYSGYVRIVTTADLEELIDIYHQLGYKDQVKTNCSNCVLNACTRIARMYYKYKDDLEKEVVTIKTLAEINKEPEVILETVVDKELEVINKDVKLLKVSKKVNKTKKK